MALAITQITKKQKLIYQILQFIKPIYWLLVMAKHQMLQKYMVLRTLLTPTTKPQLLF